MGRVAKLVRMVGIGGPPAGGTGDPYLVSADEAIGVGLPGCEIAELFFAHEGPEIYKMIHYLPAYDVQFGPFRGGFPLEDGNSRALRFLELGVSQGGSMQFWRRVFGQEASIWGVDVDPRCADVQVPGANIRIGSQADAGFLEAVVEEMGGVDIVLDDGSHIAKHQRASFETLFPLLSDRGLYAVDDLCSAYWIDYGGGYRRPGTFIEVAKQLVDGMHGWYYKRQPASIARGAKTEIESVAFYDSIVFIRKSAHGRPMTTKLGTPSFVDAPRKLLFWR